MNDLEKKLNKIILNNSFETLDSILYKEIIIKQYIKYKNDNNFEILLINQNFIFFDLCLDAISNEINKRKGYIYVADNFINDFYKVGMTKKTPEKRFKTLNSAGVFFHLKMKFFYETPDVMVEHFIHKDLINIGGLNRKHKEFFKMPLELISSSIHENIMQFENFLSNFYIK